MVDIPDYATLKTRVLDDMDDASLSTKVAGFIERAERAFDRTLWIRDRETSFTDDVTGASMALPDDCKVVRLVSVAGVGPLRQSNPFEVAAESTGAKPWAYSIEGDTIVFEPELQGTQTVTVRYWKTIPLLSDAATSNWLLLAHPDLYFYASLAQGYAFTKDVDEAAKNKAIADEIQAQISDLAKVSAYGGGPLIAQPVVPIP